MGIKFTGKQFVLFVSIFLIVVIFSGIQANSYKSSELQVSEEFSLIEVSEEFSQRYFEGDEEVIRNRVLIPVSPYEYLIECSSADYERKLICDKYANLLFVGRKLQLSPKVEESLEIISERFPNSKLFTKNKEGYLFLGSEGYISSSSQAASFLNMPTTCGGTVNILKQTSCSLCNGEQINNENAFEKAFRESSCFQDTCKVMGTGYGSEFDEDICLENIDEMIFMVESVSSFQNENPLSPVNFLISKISMFFNNYLSMTPGGDTGLPDLPGGTGDDTGGGSDDSDDDNPVDNPGDDTDTPDTPGGPGDDTDQPVTPGDPGGDTDQPVTPDIPCDPPASPSCLLQIQATRTVDCSDFFENEAFSFVVDVCPENTINLCRDFDPGQIFPGALKGIEGRFYWDWTANCRGYVGVALNDYCNDGIDVCWTIGASWRF